MSQYTPDVPGPQPGYYNNSEKPTPEAIMLNITARRLHLDNKAAQREQDIEQKQKKNSPIIESINEKGKIKEKEKNQGLFTFGDNSNKSRESRSGTASPNTPSPLPKQDRVPSPIAKTNTPQSSERSSSISTNEKNHESQLNTVSRSHSLSKPQVLTESKLQLPQQLPIHEYKDKEMKLLKIYGDMLTRIHKFKDDQRKTENDIETTKAQIEQLRQKKDEHARSIKKLQIELYDLLKQVKVTDDDLSTIQKKLAALSGKLSNFPPNSKKSFNKRGHKKSDVVEFFQKCWTSELGYSDEEKKITAQKVNDLFGKQQDIDYALVSVLVEKLVMNYFVTYIFEKPIYMDFNEINTSYNTIQELFSNAKHSEWASNLRLKCVKATLTDIEKGGIVEEQSKASRAKLCDMILEKLSAIYDKDEITSRIKKLVEMAADLSFPMNSQEERIEIIHLLPGNDFFTNQVKAQYGSDKSPTKVKLGISPVFFVKNSIYLEEDNIEDEDENFIDNEDEPEDEGDKPNIGSYMKSDYTLVYTGRAIGRNTELQQDVQQAKLEVTIDKPHAKE